MRGPGTTVGTDRVVRAINLLVLAAGIGLVIAAAARGWSEHYASPLDGETVGTSGQLPVTSPAETRAASGERIGIGGPDDSGNLIGRRVQLVIDVKHAMNDVAFWTGSPPDELLVVLDQDTRSGIERQMSRPSEAPFAAVSSGDYVTVSGIIEPVPYREAMYSWRLTDRDTTLLYQRGVYLRVDRMLSRAPDVIGSPSAREAQEWGRETAPPPGDQVETGLGLAPPKP